MLIANALAVLVSVGSSGLHAEELQRQLDNRAAATTPAPKEITPGCVTTPITTTTVGPTWSLEYATSSSERVRATVWRTPCSGANDAQLLITYTPVAGSPFVCSSGTFLLQGGQQADALLTNSPNTAFKPSQCGELFVPATFAVDQRSGAWVFDDDAAFTVILDTNASLNIPTYDPSQYGQSTGPLPFAGKLSGSYFDPTRNGEGVLLEIGQSGTRNVLLVTWYTYFQGQQRWIIGNVDFPANATTVTVPMIITSGPQFGAAYNPAQVQVTNWGSATLTFTACNRLTFAWSESGGQAATYNYQRLVDRLIGVACP